MYSVMVFSTAVLVGDLRVTKIKQRNLNQIESYPLCSIFLGCPSTLFYKNGYRWYVRWYVWVEMHYKSQASQLQALTISSDNSLVS